MKIKYFWHFLVGCPKNRCEKVRASGKLSVRCECGRFISLSDYYYMKGRIYNLATKVYDWQIPVLSWVADFIRDKTSVFTAPFSIRYKFSAR